MLLKILHLWNYKRGVISSSVIIMVYFTKVTIKFTRFFIYFLFLSDEGSMLETLDYTIRIGSIPTFLYFDLYN